MSPNGQQIPLRIGLRDGATFDNFFPGPNAPLLGVIREGREPFLYLGGATGSGRSHLLQAACHAVSEGGGSAVYLPMDECLKLSPQMLDGMEQMGLLAIDDVELIAGNQAWEEALFHLYNRIREAGHRMVVAANGPPASLGILLPDLLSRLTWGPVYQLHLLDDSAKSVALRLRARQRGMELAPEVADYLLSHASRDLHQLFELLERLDEASLAAQRRLTIPFVRSFIR